MMERTNDGGPASPVPNDANVNGQTGKSLRDYFAAHATDDDISAWIPSTTGDCWELCESIGISTGEKWRPRLRCWARYQHSDTMLRERERTQ